MTAVDFIAQFPELRLFVEVKDPDDTRATPERRLDYANKLRSDRFVADLTGKLRDSWLYQWAEGCDARPVFYVVLSQLSGLQPPELQALRDRLRKHLPLPGPRSWVRPYLDEVLVLDVAAWNALGRFGSVRRV